VTARSNKPELEFAHLRGPARDFALFCAMEMERREISKGEFDLELYKEAVKLVLHLLQSSNEGRVE
jgi:hypothetical protein